ncbi:MAG: hypothetical protein WCB86_09815 [Candidatus Dormiibacterota bacterium]
MIDLIDWVCHSSVGRRVASGEVLSSNFTDGEVVERFEVAVRKGIS